MGCIGPGQEDDIRNKALLPDSKEILEIFIKKNR